MIQLIKIEKGTKWECIKNIKINYSTPRYKGELAYMKGRIYISDEEGCITDQRGNTRHYWNLQTRDEDVFTYFKEVIDLELVSELRKRMDKAESELKSRREQITDINQWSDLLLKNRTTIRPRVLWAMIADINNRTTD